ncbi:MAG: adenylosuccinate synthase [Streptococcaceae bacterium]|jgi:adenylosuccinate synthase|nr:adenylosuccinate synthase [Streptococcaceae bacterium]
MPAIVVVGSQWGDEGKGKITDFLAQTADVIVRYQGGNNAGHSIAFAGKKFALHSIPSGIFDPSKLSIIANGVVLNPKAVLEELKYLQDNGVDTSGLRISDRAQVLFSFHKIIDGLQEEARGASKIGTTKNGIGPAYVDKFMRSGLRVADLLDKDYLAQRLTAIVEEKNLILTKLYGAEPLDAESLIEEYYGYGQQLKRYVMDTSYQIDKELRKGKKVLFEGAQGVMLDIDHGTYPYVTSSNPVGGGATIGAGVGPSKIQEVLGVCKAYCSRVGEGPFPTEQNNQIGDKIREIAHEYGVTTGRPRRIGWFDAVVMRHAVRVSGLTKLSVNCLDVFSGFETVKICVAYKLRGETIKYYPASLQDLYEAEPIYEELLGWSEDITGVTRLEDLPANALNYLKRLAELTGLEIATFAVGPERDATVVLKDLWEIASSEVIVNA